MLYILIEMVEKNVTRVSSLVSETGSYSFTLNPPDSSQYFNRSDRLEKFCIDMAYKLQSLNSNATYTAYLEVSRGGRLHIHGILTPKESIADFFLYVPYKLDLWGKYELDTIKDMEKWIEYITKDQDVTPWRHILPSLIPYPYTDEGVQDYIDFCDDVPKAPIRRRRRKKKETEEEKKKKPKTLRCYDEDSD